MSTQPRIVRATPWWQNGDHPDDNVLGFENQKTGKTGETEGKVVRYYRHPDIPGDAICETCGHAASVHGWLDPDAGGDGQKVCPGDWIIDADDCSHHVCKVDLSSNIFTFSGNADREGSEPESTANTHLPDPEDSWAKVELFRWQHGALPTDRDDTRRLDPLDGLQAMADALENGRPQQPYPHSVASVLRYIARHAIITDPSL